MVAMPAQPAGPIAGHVVENVKRLRADQRLSFVDLSERMTAVGRPILATGLHRLEHGERKVDADDVVALAMALRVSPLTLLLPPTLDGSVKLSESVVASADDAWNWARGRRPLRLEPADRDDLGLAEFQSRSLPDELRMPVVVVADSEDERDERFPPQRGVFDGMWLGGPEQRLER